MDWSIISITVGVRKGGACICVVSEVAGQSIPDINRGGEVVQVKVSHRVC